MKTNHTPGPWERGNAYNCGKNNAVCAGPQVIARVTGFGYKGGYSPESDANARLIAAAPELLEALRALESCPFDNPDHLSRALYDARAAIAKTKGE